MGKEVKKKSDEKVIIPDFFTIGQKCDESHDQSAEILPKGYYLLCIRAFFIWLGFRISINRQIFLSLSFFFDNFY